MAYDEELAARIRELVADEPGVTEKRMFGGLAFLVDGKLAVAAGGGGALMVRVAREETAALVAEPSVERMEMRGRALEGWLEVATDGVGTRRQLEPWVARSIAYARSLPAKR